MAKKYGMAVHLEDGQLGYLTNGDAKPALFDTKEDAEKELRRRLKNKNYSWRLPVTVETYVNRKED